jgi:hypothetical protein
MDSIKCADAHKRQIAGKVLYPPLEIFIICDGQIVIFLDLIAKKI